MSEEQILAQMFKIYPNNRQKNILNKTFGCTRKVWNEYVAVFNSYNKTTNPTPKYKTVKELKTIYPYLSEVPYNALEQKIRDFNEFKSQFFNKKRKKELGRPKFKCKGYSDSFRLNENGFQLVKENTKNYKPNTIQLTKKIGKVIVRNSKKFIEITKNHKIKSVTVSKDPSGDYYISILYSKIINSLEKTGKQIGIDLGIKYFLTDQHGNQVNNPKYLEKKQKKLVNLQKHISKKKKSSNRYSKTRKRIAKLHKKIRNQRNNFLHQLSKKLVKENDLICVEDLAVSNMMKNHKLARSIASASWNKFRTYLEYKCKWYGKKLTVIGR